MSSGASPGRRPGDDRDHDVPERGPATLPDDREGEYTDRDVGADDTDPPTGSYTDSDVPGPDRERPSGSQR